MGDATEPGYDKVGGAETGACVNSARTIDNDGLGGAEGKVDIIAWEKQTDANNEIYYVIHPSKNWIPTIPDKINKTPILISS